MQYEENQKILLLTTPSVEQFPEDFASRYHTHIYCERGTIKFRFNDQSFHCSSGEFILLLAGNEISKLSLSKKFNAKVLFIEKDFLLNNFPSLNFGIDAMVHHRMIKKTRKEY